MAEVEGDSRVQRLSMLASALAGRDLTVTPTESGEPAWTDGKTIFLDPDADPSSQVECLVVQASLLAGGGLEPDYVRRLSRRPKLLQRYLSIEGRRSLWANRDLLPGPLLRLLTELSVLNDDQWSTVNSPAESLAVAAGKQPVSDPPAYFGTIRVRQLLARQSASEAANSSGKHMPRREATDLAELDDEEIPDTKVDDQFSSQVGGGGIGGRLLAKLTSVVRQLGDGGNPGADSPTHRARGGTRGAGAVLSTTTSSLEGQEPDGKADRGISYPEWDMSRRRYRPDWCTVIEVDAPSSGEPPMALPDRHALRRPLARLGMGLNHWRRQDQGDDIDIDAAVEAHVELMAGSAPDEAVYVDTLRRRRDLSVLVLLDISGSVAEPGTSARSVHELQRTAAAALTATLDELGDRVALYAFQSQGRSAVHLTPVKTFDTAMQLPVLERLASLKPGAYSRLGAAIRHGSAVISEKSGTPRRLLVVLSDGLAYDHGYERLYGAADARRALGEARRQGVGCLCLTIGANTETAELQRVFGNSAHASIQSPDQLSTVIGPLFRTALASADLRRRVH